MAIVETTNFSTRCTTEFNWYLASKETPRELIELCFIIDGEPEHIYTGFYQKGNFYIALQNGKLPLLVGTKVKWFAYINRGAYPEPPEADE